jgi:hypothetical protein
MILVMFAVLAILCSILIFKELQRTPAKRQPRSSSPRAQDSIRTDANAHAARRSTVAMHARTFRAYGPDATAGRRRPRHESAAKAGRARVLARQLERGMGWPAGESAGLPHTPVERGQQRREA